MRRDGDLCLRLLRVHLLFLGRETVARKSTSLLVGHNVHFGLLYVHGREVLQWILAHRQPIFDPLCSIILKLLLPIEALREDTVAARDYFELLVRLALRIRATASSGVPVARIDASKLAVHVEFLGLHHFDGRRGPGRLQTANRVDSGLDATDLVAERLDVQELLVHEALGDRAGHDAHAGSAPRGTTRLHHCTGYGRCQNVRIDPLGGSASLHFGSLAELIVKSCRQRARW